MPYCSQTYTKYSEFLTQYVSDIILTTVVKLEHIRDICARGMRNGMA